MLFCRLLIAVLSVVDGRDEVCNRRKAQKENAVATTVFMARGYVCSPLLVALWVVIDRSTRWREVWVGAVTARLRSRDFAVTLSHELGAASGSSIILAREKDYRASKSSHFYVSNSFRIVVHLGYCFGRVAVIR